MQELETLLTSLVQRGRKPWWKLVNKILYIHPKSMLVCLNVIGKPIRQIKQDSLRELVSLESGLWQFVCENSLIKQCKGTICKNPKTYWNAWSIQWEWWYWCDIAEYRLLESSLIPEEELGEFLVENIKIDEH